MGDRARRALPGVSRGFPPAVIEPFERAIGRSVLGNVPASGTEIIAALGRRTHGDRPADRVHERRFGVPDRHARRRRPARATLRRGAAPRGDPDRAVSRRPGHRPAVRRDAGRVRRGVRSGATTACPPPGPTVLDALVDAGVGVLGVGKIQDIFDHRGLTDATYSSSNDDGHHPDDRGASRGRACVRVHEPRRLRLEVRPSQRCRRIRGGRRGARPASARPHRGARRRCPACSRATTDAIRRRRRPITRGNERRCSSRDVPAGRRSRHRHARLLRRSRRDGCRSAGVRPTWRGTGGSFAVELGFSAVTPRCLVR